jgi:Ca2+-binding RTX toxin-like protein
VGGSGHDALYGGYFLDTLANPGNSGNDTLSGGDGDDFLTGPDGTDSASGGNGNDALTFAGSAGADVLDVSNPSGTLTDGSKSLTYSGIESFSLWGFNGNDTITGGPGNDSLDGGDGDNTATGGAGDDELGSGSGRARSTEGTEPTGSASP